MCDSTWAVCIEQTHSLGNIDPSRLWHAAEACALEKSEHINILELRALIQTFQWRLRSSNFSRCRALHLTDSVVALSVCVKGRSSVLNRLLKRFAALQLAGGIYPVLGCAESEKILQMNPLAGMPTRAVENHPAKESRAHARRTVGKLRHQVLSSRSEERPKECFTEFRRFHQLPASFVLPEFEEFDEMVAEYVEVLWETGEPKTAANYTLAAIQHFRRQAKQHLPWSWKLVKAWNQVELPNRATPMSPEMVLAFAAVAFKWNQERF